MSIRRAEPLKSLSSGIRIPHSPIALPIARPPSLGSGQDHKGAARRGDGRGRRGWHRASGEFHAFEPDAQNGIPQLRPSQRDRSDRLHLRGAGESRRDRDVAGLARKDYRQSRRLYEEWDPFRSIREHVHNERLRKFGYCVVLDSFSHSIGVSDEAYCNAPSRYVQRTNLYQERYAEYEMEGPPKPNPGIVYKPRQHYRVFVYHKHDPGGGSPWMLQYATDVRWKTSRRYCRSISIEPTFTSRRSYLRSTTATCGSLRRQTERTAPGFSRSRSLLPPASWRCLHRSCSSAIKTRLIRHSSPTSIHRFWQINNTSFKS